MCQSAESEDVRTKLSPRRCRSHLQVRMLPPQRAMAPSNKAFRKWRAGLGNTYLHRACGLHGLQGGGALHVPCRRRRTFCSSKGGFAKMSSNLRKYMPKPVPRKQCKEWCYQGAEGPTLVKLCLTRGLPEMVGASNPEHHTTPAFSPPNGPVSRPEGPLRESRTPPGRG